MGKPSTMSAEELPRGNNEILGVHLGHQEVERVITMLDSIFEYMPQEQWLQEVTIVRMCCDELGYEDEQEFHDALRCTFAEFVSCFPHLETLPAEEGKEDAGFRIRMVAETPEDERVPLKLVYKINSTKDLWRVCLKSKGARVWIPEIEFEISADGMRHVDTVYNHIADAIFKLGQHVQEQAAAGVAEDERFTIMDTAAALNIMLDVEDPWTWIVHDPDGLSTFKPDGEGDGSVI